MTSKLLWGLAIALLLLVCLGIGLGIGRVFAPTPMVGVVRFDEVIDFDTAAAVNAVLEQAASDQVPGNRVVGQRGGREPRHRHRGRGRGDRQSGRLRHQQ